MGKVLGRDRIPLVLVLASSPLHSFATIFGAAFTGLGLIFVLTAIVMMVVSGRFARHSSRAQGRIVDFVAADPTVRRVPGTPVGHTTGPRMGPPAGPAVDPLAQPSPDFCRSRRSAAGDHLQAHGHVHDRRRAAGDGDLAHRYQPAAGQGGDTVTVHYDPHDPQHIQVSSTRKIRGCVETGFILIGAPVRPSGSPILLAAH